MTHLWTRTNKSSVKMPDRVDVLSSHEQTLNNTKAYHQSIHWITTCFLKGLHSTPVRESPFCPVPSPCSTAVGWRGRWGTVPWPPAAWPSGGWGRTARGPSAAGPARGIASAGLGTDLHHHHPCQAHTAAQGNPVEEGERDRQDG